jgi:hypothetical protein
MILIWMWSPTLLSEGSKNVGVAATPPRAITRACVCHENARAAGWPRALFRASVMHKTPKKRQEVLSHIQEPCLHTCSRAPPRPHTWQIPNNLKSRPLKLFNKLLPTNVDELNNISGKNFHCHQWNVSEQHKTTLEKHSTCFLVLFSCCWVRQGIQGVL